MTGAGPQSSGGNGLWLAVYVLSAVLFAAAAVLIASLVGATGMEAATAGGATFLASIGLTITVHRFLRGS